MKSLTRSLLVVLAASILGCSAQKEPDAMLEAVLTEFSARDEINEFGKDDLILLSSRTQIWTKEQLRGMGTDPKSTCQIPEDLYDSLAKVTQTLPTAHLMRTNTNWRMATDEQQKARCDVKRTN